MVVLMLGWSCDLGCPMTARDNNALPKLMLTPAQRRAVKLELALRDNLKKRKDQARVRSGMPLNDDNSSDS
jgi:hypothetical protein